MRNKTLNLFTFNYIGINNYTVSFSSDYEWENEINDRGELFYVKCSPRTQTNYVKRNAESTDDVPKKNQSTAGKLVKLLKRKKRGRDRNDGGKHTGNTNKVTFLDTQVCQYHDRTYVKVYNRRTFGRRKAR